MYARDANCQLVRLLQTACIVNAHPDCMEHGCQPVVAESLCRNAFDWPPRLNSNRVRGPSSQPGDNYRCPRLLLFLRFLFFFLIFLFHGDQSARRVFPANLYATLVMSMTKENIPGALNASKYFLFYFKRERNDDAALEIVIFFFFVIFVIFFIVVVGFVIFVSVVFVMFVTFVFFPVFRALGAAKSKRPRGTMLVFPRTRLFINKLESREGGYVDFAPQRVRWRNANCEFRFEFRARYSAPTGHC